MALTTMRRAKQITVSFALAMLATSCAVVARQTVTASTVISAAKSAAGKTQPPAKTPAQTPANTKSQTSSPAKPKPQQQAGADKKQTGAIPPAAKPAGRRDPFVTLVGKQNGGGSDGAGLKLPPGKAGLQVSTVILQGIVSGPNGMIAVVANPQRSVYFLHEGDELFDGKVAKIDMGGVTFHEFGKDAFGKPLEREVTKKLNPSSGEQP